METVLIIEDEPAMLRGLEDNFRANGFNVITATDGETGLGKALVADIDLIILDIMLPKINGYEICQTLRKKGSNVPIIMLTAKSEESDIVLGLNIGADDYVTKPFSIRQLLARASALLRRTKQQGPTACSFGPYVLDLKAMRLTCSGREIPLSPKEFRLLEFFVTHAGQALTRDKILNAVWGYDSPSGPRCVDRFVTTLRQKIEIDCTSPKYIHTVRDVGYRFEPPGPISWQ